jgi:hypothetical protein
MGGGLNTGEALRSARIVRRTWDEVKASPLSNTNPGLGPRRRNAMRLWSDGGVKSDGGVGDGDRGVTKVEMQVMNVVGGKVKGEYTAAARVTSG